MLPYRRILKITGLCLLLYLNTMASPTTNITNTTTTIVTTTVMTPIVTTSSGGAAASLVPELGNISRIPAMYSLGMIAATLEDFNGRNVSRYLEKLEQRARLDKWTEAETLQLLKFKCVGDAYDFFRADTSLDGLSFRDLKARLISKFAVTRLPGESQLNLSRCYQRHDENVSSFCIRLRILGAHVLEEDLRTATPEEQAGIKRKNQDLILNQFKIGLRKEIMREVGVLLLKEVELTLDKAEELVKLQETTLRMMQGKASGKVFQITCFGCGKLGHTVRECQNPRQAKFGGSTEAPSGSPKCYACGRAGHFARECRNVRHGNPTEGQMGCFICHQSGHWARECPQRGTGDRRFDTNGSKREGGYTANRGENTGAVRRADQGEARGYGQQVSRREEGPKEKDKKSLN